MEEVFEKIIEFIHSEIERTISYAEHDTLINVEFFVDDLKEKYNNGWIPCSERLPDELGRYIVTLKDGRSLEAIYDNISKRFIMYEYEVVAWMPMPQPYKISN